MNIFFQLFDFISNKIAYAYAVLRFFYLRRRMAHLGEFAQKNPIYALGFSAFNYHNISIGKNCSFGGNVLLAGHGKIVIGNNCLFAYGSSVITATHDYRVHPMNSMTIVKDTKIGENVWIGAGAIILPGVSIGDNVVIGAGAVVTKNIPSGHIATGVPANNLRTLSR